MSENQPDSAVACALTTLGITADSLTDQVIEACERGDKARVRELLAWVDRLQAGPSDSAVVRAAREAIEAFKRGCFVDAGNALRSLDAALSASPPPDAGTCRCVGTRRYTDGKCDKCGNRIVTEEPK